MKNLSKGIRVRLAFQQYSNAMTFGTAIVLEYDERTEMYKVLRDLDGFSDSAFEDEFGEWHVIPAMIQPSDEEVDRPPPIVRGAWPHRLTLAGYREGLHFNRSIREFSV